MSPAAGVRRGHRPRPAPLLGGAAVLLLAACASVTSPESRSSLFASGLGDPAGVALAPGGLLLVADAERGEVVVFDAEGRRLGAFGVGILRSPLGLAVDADGSVLVSDSMQDRVFRFDRRGALLSSFGKSGDGDGEFSGAGPLDVAPNGDVYVTDIDNNRIQVFDREGKFRLAFGKEGHFGDSAPGELYFPGGLAVDGTGRVYLADTHNFRVQVFSATGQVERVWGRQGTEAGEFDHPFGIAIDERKGLVYVVDDHIKLEGGGLRVLAFTPEGEPRGWLAPPRGQPPLHHPFDVAVAPDGRIFVSERSVGRIRALFPGDLQSVPGASRPSSRPASRPSFRPTDRVGRENK